MEFVLTLKELIGAVITILTIGIGWANVHSRVRKLEDATKTIKRIIFLDKGGLNIVTRSDCKEKNDTVFDAIRREARVTKAAFREINILHQNVIKIMIAMHLEPISPHNGEGENGYGEDK